MWTGRSHAAQGSIHLHRCGALFPDELSQIPTAGSLRPSVLSRLCDYLDWLQRLIISPLCIIATPPPQFLLSIHEKKKTQNKTDKADFECLQSFYARFFSRHPPQSSSVTKAQLQWMLACRIIIFPIAIMNSCYWLFCQFHLKKNPTTQALPLLPFANIENMMQSAGKIS